MTLEQADADRICKRVVDYDVDTKVVAEQFGISRRRVQQLAKAYRETGELPELETPGRKPYAGHPADLDERVLELHQLLDIGAVAIAHVLRTRDGLSIANNRVHAILQEHDYVTENLSMVVRETTGFPSCALHTNPPLIKNVCPCP